MRRKTKSITMRSAACKFLLAVFATCHLTVCAGAQSAGRGASNPTPGPGESPETTNENSSPAQAPNGFGEVVSDEVVVRFNAQTAARLHARMFDGAARRLPGLPGFLAADDPLSGVNGLPAGVLGITGLQSGRARVMRAAGQKPDLGERLDRGEKLDAGQRANLAAEAARIHRARGPVGLFRMKLNPDVPALEVIEQLRHRPDVVYAEPNPVYEITSAPNDPYFSTLRPDPKPDPDLTFGWNLERINMPAAWDLASSVPGNVRVCVIDTGVRLDHVELAGRIADPKDVHPDDGDAYADEDASNDDPNGHGTMCAGIIGAIRDNGSLIAGMAPVTIIPVNASKFVDGKVRIVNSADGIYWGVDHGAAVISCSFGGVRSAPTQAQADAISYAQTNNVIVVASSGNSNTTGDNVYPAAIPYCISVGAVDWESQRVNPANGWTFGSNHGATLDVCAPGVKIATLRNRSSTDKTTGFQGTSAAAPHVAGLCALLKHINPALTALQIRKIVEGTALDQVGSPSEDTPGFDIYHGHGLINAAAAAAAAMATALTPMSAGSETLPPFVDSASPKGGEALASTNDTITLSVSATDLDGDTLSYAWFFNDAVVPGEVSDSWAFLTSPTFFGEHEARVEISDGTFVVSNSWSVVVGNNEPGLAAYWTFENGSGVDVSGRGHNLSISGRVETSASGIEGEALRFRP